MMLVRRAVAFMSLGLLAVALLVEILYPAYATLVSYLLLIWVVASLLMFFGRPGDRTAAGPTASPAPAALPGASGPPVAIDFCVYCATPLTSGAAICPNCGRAARPI